MWRRIFLSLVLIFVMQGMSYCQQEEKITITTYYPSPYGVYKNLRLYPSSQPTGNAVQEGVMFYDDSKNALSYYNGTTWVALTNSSFYMEVSRHNCTLQQGSAAYNDCFCTITCPSGYIVLGGGIDSSTVYSDLGRANYPLSVSSYRCYVNIKNCSTGVTSACCGANCYAICGRVVSKR